MCFFLFVSNDNLYWLISPDGNDMNYLFLVLGARMRTLQVVLVSLLALQAFGQGKKNKVIFQRACPAPIAGHMSISLLFFLKFPPGLPLTWANSIGFGETARMRRLAWTFAVRICYNGLFSQCLAQVILQCFFFILTRFKGTGDVFRGRQLCPNCLPTFWQWTKRKELAPLGSKFFPFRVDPLSDGTWCTGN